MALFCFWLSSILGAPFAGRAGAFALGSIPVRRITSANNSSPDMEEYLSKLS